MCGVTFEDPNTRFGDLVSWWVVFPLRAREKRLKNSINRLN
jgi:hypothetical protein